MTVRSRFGTVPVTSARSRSTALTKAKKSAQCYSPRTERFIAVLSVLMWCEESVHECFLLTVRLVERQGLCCQVVGTFHVQMFYSLHWSGSNRQAAVSQHSCVQPHRRLRYYHWVNNDITFFVVLKYFTIIILLILVFFPDEKTISLCCWDSRNSERQRLLNLGQTWLKFRLSNYGSSRDKFIAA